MKETNKQFRQREVKRSRNEAGGEGERGQQRDRERETENPRLDNSLGISCPRLLSPENVEEGVGAARQLAITNVHAYYVRGGEGTADIPLGLGNNDVHLGSEHAPQGHRHTEAHCEASRDDLVVAPKVNGHESQPDDAGSVHGEGNVFSLIEVGGHIAGLEGIVGTAHDEESIVAHRGHYTQVAGIADKVDFLDTRVGQNGHGRLHDDQGHH